MIGKRFEKFLVNRDGLFRLFLLLVNEPEKLIKNDRVRRPAKLLYGRGKMLGRLGVIRGFLVVFPLGAEPLGLFLIEYSEPGVSFGLEPAPLADGPFE